MCGIAGILTKGSPPNKPTIERMTGVLAHRGPDAQGVWLEDSIALGSRRLSIFDLSSAGNQPMQSDDGRFVISHNGEVYNFPELRGELGGEFQSDTDTEVVLKAFAKWGDTSLDRLNGMWAFAIWDRQKKELTLARDRFGIKPLYYAYWEGNFYFASEIKALAAAGVPMEADEATWSLYLTKGLYDHSEQTFFKGVKRLLPGHILKMDSTGSCKISCWYNLAERTMNEPLDSRSDEEVAQEVLELMEDAVRLRFRADVPVGICVSGGLDSSLLVGLLRKIFGTETKIHAYHYATGDPAYDETPWARKMLEGCQHALHITTLRPEEVPSLAREVAYYQEEPFGGLNSLASVRLFENAQREGAIVLLGGEGLDEQWAGYDYYRQALTSSAQPEAVGPVQASRSKSTRPHCLTEEFRAKANAVDFPALYDEPIKNWLHRDLKYAKIPRALRFVDRTSSQNSNELRVPFLDHRLVELAFKQPTNRMIRQDVQKYLPREIARSLLPNAVSTAPKRPVQTPQREWFRGPLRAWVEECLASDAVQHSGWFDTKAIQQEWKSYLTGKDDNSFFVLQWISVALNASVLESFKSLRSEPASD